MFSKEAKVKNLLQLPELPLTASLIRLYSQKSTDILISYF